MWEDAASQLLSEFEESGIFVVPGFRYIQLCQMHSNQDTETAMPEGKAVADVRFSFEH